MNWLKGLLGGEAKRSDSTDDSNALWLYVQCDRCGTPLAVRIDRQHEISTDYEAGVTFLRKELMDAKCFQLMYAELRFDRQGNVAKQAVEGGHIISREEYHRISGEAK